MIYPLGTFGNMRRKRFNHILVRLLLREESFVIHRLCRNPNNQTMALYSHLYTGDLVFSSPLLFGVRVKVRVNLLNIKYLSKFTKIKNVQTIQAAIELCGSLNTKPYIRAMPL